MGILNKEFYKQHDKQIHIIGEAMVSSLVAGSIIVGLNDALGWLVYLIAYISGVGVAAQLGWIKELRDGEGYGTRDIDDIDADMVGANIGALLTCIVLCGVM